MGTWKGAWFIALHELNRDRWKLLLSLIFIAYFLLFSFLIFTADLENANSKFAYWPIDFIYLSVLPCLGFIVNMSMMNCWKSDAFTKKISDWRTLPISSKQIALGRIILLIIVLTAAQSIFFLAQYILMNIYGVDISPLEFILYAFVWYFYSMTATIFYIYFEIGHTGKQYFIMNFVYIFSILALVIILSSLGFGNIVNGSLNAVENGRWWIVLIAFGAAVASIFIGLNLMARRLENRTYRV